MVFFALLVGSEFISKFGRENPDEIWVCLDLFGSCLGQKISALAVMFRSVHSSQLKRLWVSWEKTNSVQQNGS